MVAALLTSPALALVEALVEALVAQALAVVATQAQASTEAAMGAGLRQLGSYLAMVVVGMCGKLSRRSGLMT
jgi:hypothetical protein